MVFEATSHGEERKRQGRGEVREEEERELSRLRKSAVSVRNDRPAVSISAVKQGEVPRHCDTSAMHDTTLR